MSIRVKIVVASLVIGAFAGPALAANCSGVTSRTSEAPITVIEEADGTTKMLIRSTGTVTIVSPKEMVRTQWQHCVGLLTVKPDGSNSGSGNCYSLDADGDAETITWEGQNGTGTWTQIGGTGKHAGDKDSGTWKSGRQLGNGLAVGSWQGDCSH